MSASLVGENNFADDKPLLKTSKNRPKDNSKLRKSYLLAESKISFSLLVNVEGKNSPALSISVDCLIRQKFGPELAREQTAYLSRKIKQIGTI